MAVPGLHRRRRQEDEGHPALRRPRTAPGSSARPIRRRWSSPWSSSMPWSSWPAASARPASSTASACGPTGCTSSTSTTALFTSIFLHLNFLHIAFNMITLLIVGPAVEVMLGKARFLRPVPAGRSRRQRAGSYLIAPANQVGAGASGAIFGVMGAYVVLARLRHKAHGPGGRTHRHQPGDRFHRQHRVAGPHRRTC